MKNRQDAWLDEQDLLLAETVLTHVREGSTQLKAFEEVGDKLNRTAAACGFRWNAVVRQQYTEAMMAAKKHRNQRSRLKAGELSAEAQSPPSSSPKIKETERTLLNFQNITMSDVLAYLTNFISFNEPELLKKENDRLSSELYIVTQERNRLRQQLEQHKEASASMQEDYESVMKIMDRARKFVAFAEEKPIHATFKMDRNGNLEKIAD